MERTKRPAGDDEADRTTELFFTLARQAFGQVKKHLSESDLSMAQVHSLFFVCHNKDPLMKDLAHHLGITPPSATVLVNGLLAAGLVEKQTDRKDRRVSRLKISAKGKKLLRMRLKLMTRGLEQVLEPLSATERDQLSKILKKAIEANKSTLQI